MKPGLRTCLPTGKIDYKELRKVNAETARKAVLEYLKSNDGNVADCARTFVINRPVVYDILKKQRQGDLKDRSKAPRNQPNKTPAELEWIQCPGTTPKIYLACLFPIYTIDQNPPLPSQGRSKTYLVFHWTKNSRSSH